MTNNLKLANLVNPSSWKLTTEEVAEALLIPVGRIIKFTQLPHCICVVWRGDQGQKCSRFHSYRLFTRWQKATESLIAICNTQEQMEQVATAIKFDLCHYKYKRFEVANGIWSAVLRQQKALNKNHSKARWEGSSTKGIQLSLF